MTTYRIPAMESISMGFDRSLQDVDTYSVGYCLEGLSQETLSSVFNKLVSSARSAIAGSRTIIQNAATLVANFANDLVELKLAGEIFSFNKPQLFSTLKAVPYTSVGEMSASVPEGMKSTYLDAINAVEDCVARIPVSLKMLDEYEMFLAQFVGDKKFNVSLYDDRKIHELAEKQRAALYATVGRQFVTDSYKSSRKIKEVIKRNSDWATVIEKTEGMVRAVQAVDREVIDRKIKQCSAYLDIIIEDFKKEKDRKVSQEAAARLGNMTISVAKEIEFFSITFYRVLSIKGSVDNTCKAIQAAMG